MGKLNFNIKEESIHKFMEDNLVELSNYRLVNNDSNFSNKQEKISPYHYMRDIIYIKKECITNGKVLFELYDTGRNVHAVKLVHSYIYRVEKHDDISIKLILENFSTYINN